MLPGDAASASSAGRPQPEQLAELRELMGLDRPAPRALLRLAGRPLHGRPRQLGRRVRAGRRAADLERRSSGKIDELVRPRRRSRRCSMVPLSLRPRSRGGAARGPADRPRDLDRLAGGHLAARVRASARCSSSSSSPGSTCCRPSSLIPPGDEPARRARQARPAGADAARRDPGRVDPHGARRDDRGAPRRTTSRWRA